jgi:hypothetical protein
MENENDKEGLFVDKEIFLSLSIMSQILIIMVYLIVSVKYGFFPNEYFKRFKRDLLLEHMIKANYLDHGWINPKLDIIDELINESLINNKIDLSIFNLQCLGEVDDKLVHELKMIEIQIGKDKEKMKIEYVNYLIKRLQMNKLSILKGKDAVDKLKIMRNSNFNENKIKKKRIRKCATNIEVNEYENEDNLIKKSKIISNVIENEIIDLGKGKNKSDTRSKSLNNNLSSNGFHEENLNEIEIDIGQMKPLKSFNNKILNNDIKEKFDVNADENVISKFKLDDENEREKEKLREIKEDENESESENENENENKYETEIDEKESYHLCKRLKNIVINKIIPLIKEKRKQNIDKIKSLKGKIRKISDKVFEINGLYLCRLMMKKAHEIKYEGYRYFHIISFAVLMIIPNLLIGMIFFMQTEINENKSFNKTLGNNTVDINNLNITQIYINNTNSLIQNQNKTLINDMLSIQFHFHSLLFWIFSNITCLIPTWFILKILIYGVIDFSRRRELIYMISGIIDFRSKQEKEFPLINISHYETLMNWYTLRNIFVNYGKRFTDRIIIQVAICGVIAILSLIVITFTFFGYIQSLSIIVKNK